MNSWSGSLPLPSRSNLYSPGPFYIKDNSIRIEDDTTNNKNSNQKDIKGNNINNNMNNMKEGEQSQSGRYIINNNTSIHNNNNIHYNECDIAKERSIYNSNSKRRQNPPISFTAVKCYLKLRMQCILHYVNYHTTSCIVRLYDHIFPCFRFRHINTRSKATFVFVFFLSVSLVFLYAHKLLSYESLFSDTGPKPEPSLSVKSISTEIFKGEIAKTSHLTSSNSKYNTGDENNIRYGYHSKNANSSNKYKNFSSLNQVTHTQNDFDQSFLNVNTKSTNFKNNKMTHNHRRRKKFL